MHSRRTDPIKRSTYPFCQGDRNEVGPVPDAHRSDAGLECGAECSVIVANEILRCAVVFDYVDCARRLSIEIQQIIRKAETRASSQTRTRRPHAQP